LEFVFSGRTETGQTSKSYSNLHLQKNTQNNDFTLQCLCGDFLTKLGIMLSCEMLRRDKKT
jgi:hypothetical protein